MECDDRQRYGLGSPAREMIMVAREEQLRLVQLEEMLDAVASIR